MRRFAILLVMASAPAFAGSVDDAERPCLIEPFERGRAACIGYLADAQLMKTEGRIARATMDLQAAGAREVQAFEQGLIRSQKRWRDGVLAECRQGFPTDRVGFQRCRLDRALARDDAVRVTLNAARAQMGLAPVAEVPEEIEVLIPLPGAPAGPDADLRVPLRIPIQP